MINVTVPTFVKSFVANLPVADRAAAKRVFNNTANDAFLTMLSWNDPAHTEEELVEMAVETAFAEIKFRFA